MTHSIDQIRSGALMGATRIKLQEELTTFPRDIFNLSDSLEILDLSDNSLSSLPDDFGKLEKLKILFLSNNAFREVPKVLRTCPNLEMIAFKSNQISTFPENALPLTTKWLMLTDNQIERLPQSFGELTSLRKLALAGNELTEIPESIANCRNLELARFSANQLSLIPNSLLELPKLSWLGFGGNPCTKRVDINQLKSHRIRLNELELKDKIGEDASGVIYSAVWKSLNKERISLQDQVAVKLFKGNLTSDGFAQDEMECCIAAGNHPSLINVIGHIAESDQLGLVMELVSIDYLNLGQPPNFKTCTRDTFPNPISLELENLSNIAEQVASLLGQLHNNRVAHGDLYAHNIMINSGFHSLLGDFGAATQLTSLDLKKRELFEKIEVRAFGCLLDDLIRSVKSPTDGDRFNRPEGIVSQCLSANFDDRPTFSKLSTLL